MRNIPRYMMLFFFSWICLGIAAQTKSWKEMHKVKKKETVYGIAKEYGLTEEELRKANPEMNKEGYTLKKGDYIFIPYPSKAAATVSASAPSKTGNAAVSGKAVRVGVMLPLHDMDGDGRRMVEFYRGVLLACEDLKKEGVSVDVKAWNVGIDADIRQTLLAEGANQCDVIFGPLYTKQMPELSKFVKAYNIRLVVPFSIGGNYAEDNSNIYQVYQSDKDLTDAAIGQFFNRFHLFNVVFVDCNDKNSDKGGFTFGLRKKLEENNIDYRITNLTSSDEMFVKAFALDKPNIVILNTGRSPELNAALSKLDALRANNKGLAISLFGYNEWLMYEKYSLDKFYQYDTFIPSYYYYNPVSAKTQSLESDYRKWFGTSMMNALPRFAITGYDQATFFLRGIHLEGKNFKGNVPDKDAVQTSFRFYRKNKNGGWQNRMFMFVHYNRNKTISTIVF
ncbi:MAG: LysM peptidoglycan-binding domain-containing protein [Prevotella sp.]|nr:LysM peptidoglycan-binding domain-containing protein [Prevotella sp.]